MPKVTTFIKSSHPQEENLKENEPGGFHLIPLPFADDIRSAPIEEAARGLHALPPVPPVFLKPKFHHSIQPTCGSS